MNRIVQQLLGCACGLACALSSAEQAPDLQRAALSILEARCFDCHGPQARKGGLRLSNVGDATLGGDSGVPLVVPHEPDAGSLLARVTSQDDALRMPPGGERLSADEIATLTAWIEGGAPWGGGASTETDVTHDHWAFQAPEQAPLPDTANGAWARNPIDAFVLDRLQQEGLAPSPEADRHTLIRRLYLDLVGLPPSPEAVEAFVADTRADAYEHLVDRLLASPHYGERQAIRWLDAARYADTNGYEKDRARSIWPWRDWVIDAYNDDMPYDRFVVEQLAGDLLPGGDIDQKIATGFLRNSIYNEEGGVDVGEVEYEAMVDRADTVGTVMLGLTMTCARCHTHKTDPITQREYFQFMAFINNTNDAELALPDPEITQARAEIEAEIEGLLAGLAEKFPEGENESRDAHLARRQAAWEAAVSARAREWTVLNPLAQESKNGATLVRLNDRSILARGRKTNTDTYVVTLRVDEPVVRGIRIEVLPHESLPGGGPGRGIIMSEKEGGFLLGETRAAFAPWDAPDALTPVALAHASANYEAEGRLAEQTYDGQTDTGWMIGERTGEPHAIVYEFAEPVQFDGAGILRLELDQHYVHQHTIGRFRVSATAGAGEIRASGVPAGIEEALLIPREARSEAQSAQVRDYFLRTAPELSDVHEQVARLRSEMPQYETTLVLEERGVPRMTHIRHRGEYLKVRDAVGPGVPAVLHDFPEAVPPNRLTFARWLVSEESPLTARVVVNRIWQTYFGRGIVNTPDDFGLTGAAPTHPELLDWLAVEFMRRGWSMKDLTRMVVTSATYRQSSRATEDLLRVDPANELLARGPRFRVEAEIVRDIALSASGLLNPEVGGPSVYPPLPESLLKLAYGNTEWYTGDDSPHRRGLYTYWKRALPYPNATTFDAPGRDTACVRRVRSNTPLQALTMLNNEVYVEASRAMALRVLQEGKASDPERLQHAFMLVTARAADTAEIDALAAFLENQRRHFARHSDEAAALAGLGEGHGLRRSEVAERAAWTALCRALLNLDETITKA